MSSTTGGFNMSFIALGIIVIIVIVIAVWVSNDPKKKD